MGNDIDNLEKKINYLNDRINNKHPETVSFMVYESETCRLQSQNDLLIKLLFISFAAITIVVIAFLVFLSQFNFGSYDQSGDNNNLNNNIKGDIYNGATSTNNG